MNRNELKRVRRKRNIAVGCSMDSARRHRPCYLEPGMLCGATLRRWWTDPPTTTWVCGLPCPEWDVRRGRECCTQWLKPIATTRLPTPPIPIGLPIRLFGLSHVSRTWWTNLVLQNKLKESETNAPCYLLPSKQRGIYNGGRAINIHIGDGWWRTYFSYLYVMNSP